WQRAGDGWSGAADDREVDVCVVGGGAGGGMAARMLTETGPRVTLLERAPLVAPSEFAPGEWRRSTGTRSGRTRAATGAARTKVWCPVQPDASAGRGRHGPLVGLDAATSEVRCQTAFHG